MELTKREIQMGKEPLEVWKMYFEFHRLYVKEREKSFYDYQKRVEKYKKLRRKFL